MKRKLNIEKIVNELELISDEGISFLNLKTGQLFHMDDKELEYAKNQNEISQYLYDWQSSRIQIAKKIFENGEYIQLPVKEEINECKILLDFCLSKSEDAIIHEINKSLRLYGPDVIRLQEIFSKFNIGKEWYQYKREAFGWIAKEWCKKNSIEFISENVIKKTMIQAKHGK